MAAAETVREKPGCAALFYAFFIMGVSGFGSVLPWARRVIVEQRDWMDAEGFNDLLALCQLIPGPNIVNFAVVFGDRSRGPAGSVAAVLGVTSAPVAIVITLAVVFGQVTDQHLVSDAFHGLAAAASGLVIATAIKIGRPLARPRAPARRDWRGIAMALVAFAVIGLAQLPLLPSLAVLAPAAVALQLARGWL